MLKIVEELLPKLRANSSEIDELGDFPHENLNLLKKAGLFNYLIPKNYGGEGGDFATFIELAKLVSTGCLSTGIMWSMHCQQVACIVEHSSQEFKDLHLSEIAAQNYYLGSITTERGNDSYLLSSLSPLLYEEEYAFVKRIAPVVTGGEHCDAYLITMKESVDSTTSDVKLVYAKKSQLTLELNSKWSSLGMKGTNSIAMTVSGKVPLINIVNRDFSFDRIAYESMIPIGHIGWSSCWLAAVNYALREMIKVFRQLENRSKFDLESELFLERLARIRLDIQSVDSMLLDTSNQYQFFKEKNRAKLKSTSFLLKSNGLKVFSSEVSFKAINSIMDLAGMKYGYMKNQTGSLERIFRDIRSAAFMINNNKLLIGNGKLTLLEKHVD